MSSYHDLKHEAYIQNIRLPELGLIAHTFGNTSVSDQSKGIFAIKPSGVAYSALTPDQMVVVDFSGGVVEGTLRPSSDTPTHAALYQHWPGLGGITHTHSPYGTCWAQAMRSIPIFGTTHADYAHTDIPCVPPLEDERIIAGYEYHTGLQIVNYFRENKLNYKEVQMVLLAGHAPFTWGTTGGASVDHSSILEYIARMAYMTEQLNPDAGRLKTTLIDKHYNRKHGSQAYYGQSPASAPDVRNSLWLNK